MTTEQIYLKEKQISKILGIFIGGSNYDEKSELVTSRTHFESELSHNQLTELMAEGEVSIKRSGAGLRITIQYYL
jgi:hypothetical protein